MLLALAATVPLVFGTAPARAAEVTLTYAFFAPAGTFPGRQMAHWAEQLKQRTNGKVEVKLFPGGTLLNAATSTTVSARAWPTSVSARRRTTRGVFR